jgi:hypothetical protein
MSNKYSNPNSIIINKWVLLLLINLFCFNASIKAEVVSGLYQAEVIVQEQTSKLPWNSVLVGFKEVLIKKSGTSQVLTSHDIQKAYAKVTTYLQRYEYIKKLDQDNNERLYLVLNFEPKLVDDLIRSSDMPILSNNRPVTIVWLAIEESRQRQVIKDEETGDSRLASILKKAAKRRGIPVILPLMDLEDRQNLSISDLWGRFTQPIIMASNRYSTDSILAGSIRRRSGAWQAQLIFINQGIEQSIDISESTIDSLLNTVVDNMSELLSAKYSVVETYQSNELIIQVSNIHNFKSFNQVKTILANMPSIRKVEVKQASQAHIQFSVNLLGDISVFQEGISRVHQLSSQEAPYPDPFLKSSEQQFSGAIDNIILYYRWDE